MARILVAWEMGGGMGHLTGVTALAVQLARNGHEVALAVPQPDTAKPLLRERLPSDLRVDVVQGVGWRAFKEVRGQPADKVATLTLADVLMLFGWDDPRNIGPRVRAWENLVARLKPDRAIADFAPTLRLATQGHLPLAMMGTGYSMPPYGRLLPPIRPWHGEVVAYSRANEGAALASVNRLRAAMKRPAVDHLADLFHGDRSFPCTVPEFDPYRAFRRTPTLAPHNIEPVPDGGPLAERPARALVHLPAGHALLPAALWACHDVGLTPELVLRGGGDPPAERPPSTVVHRVYVDLGERLPKVRACLHHGGLGLAYAAAMAGTPQILLTEKLEHQVTARAVAAHGAGVTYTAGDSPDRARIESDLASLLGAATQTALHRLAAAMPRSGGHATLARIARFAERDGTS